VAKTRAAACVPPPTLHRIVASSNPDESAHRYGLGAIKPRIHRAEASRSPRASMSRAIALMVVLRE
jgi:hypothetical protein